MGSPITPEELSDPVRFKAIHQGQMETIRRICEETVPAKTETKVRQTHKLSNGEFNRLWGVKTAAYKKYVLMTRPTRVAQRNKAEALAEYEAAYKLTEKAMANKRVSHWWGLADEIEKAYNERRPADFYRAIRKINAKPKATEHEEPDESKGAVKKLDGSLTRGRQETNDRWTQHFRDLFNQECPLVPYPAAEAAAEYCGRCAIQPASVCGRRAHNNPGQGVSAEEQGIERGVGGSGDNDYVWLRDSELWDQPER
jgi:hypothetical protein